jgi:hypothetical protein
VARKLFFGSQTNLQKQNELTLAAGQFATCGRENILLLEQPVPAAEHT